jgi:hypothetical protein
MDAKFFRLPSEPNFYTSQKEVVAVYRQREAVTQDARFPGWAAPLEDGRLVTDYRPHCETNIPTGSQEATRVWMQKNTDNILMLSRQRMSERTGMAYGINTSIVPPPAVLEYCTTASCIRIPTGASMGIGMERRSGPLPMLFGTYEAGSLLSAPTPNVQLTHSYEGGRNTPRG